MPSSVTTPSSAEGSPARKLTTAADVVLAAAQQHQLSMSMSAIGTGTGGPDGSPSQPSSPAVNNRALTPIALIFDSLTFEKRQTRWLKDMEKTVELEKKRKRKEWEREVERMREEFLRLYPLDRKWGSDELIVDPLVARRRGSTDILDIRRMKTMYSSHELGQQAGHHGNPPSVAAAVSKSTVGHSATNSESPERKKFRLRFDLTGFDPESIRVSVDPERIIVRATRVEDGGMRREYGRKIEKPRNVDANRIKASLTADGVLVVGASIQPPQSPSGRLNRTYIRGSAGSRGSSTSRSPPVVGSPIAGQGPAELKPGIPVFRDEIGGQRRLHLLVEVGTMFRPNDVTVQVIKDTRLMIRGRHEERTSEYIAKNKYSKEIDLSERIDGQSVRGGFAADGKLFITAVAKSSSAGGGSGAGAGTVSSSVTPGPSNASIAGPSSVEGQPEDVDGVESQEQIPLDVEELLLIDSHGVELLPCNVLDLASFPPTVPATASQG